MYLVKDKYGKEFLLRKLVQSDGENLAEYFDGLSDSTKELFQPHSLTNEFAIKICKEKNSFDLCFVLTNYNNIIVAYFYLTSNFISHEVDRYRTYGISLESKKTAFFAPSVADNIQNSGLASAVMPLLIGYLKDNKFDTIVLLGGVQETNQQAVRFYKKFNFTVVGSYLTHVKNLDMVLNLPLTPA